MENCIFCKIAAGDVPSYKVYEDEVVYAFLDLSQVTKGHTLIIPKKHVTDIFEYDEELASAVFARILNNNKELAYQSVFHSHIHLIPRYEKTDDFSVHFGDHEGLHNPDEMQAIADAIAKQVN